MAQHDLTIANQLFPDFRTDLNAAIGALASSNSGNSAPPTLVKGMFWLDLDSPAATTPAIKMYDGTTWITLGLLDIPGGRFLVSGGDLGSLIVAVDTFVELLTTLGVSATISSLLQTTTLRGAQEVLKVPTLLATATASSSGFLAITTDLDNDFDRYEIWLNAIKLSVDDALLLAQVGTGAGPTWEGDPTDYTTGANFASSTAQIWSGGIAAGMYLTLYPASVGAGVGNFAGATLSGRIRFNDPETSNLPLFRIETEYMRPIGQGLASITGAASYNTAGPFTAFRIAPSSGVIVSGNMQFWGFPK